MNLYTTTPEEQHLELLAIIQSLHDRIDHLENQVDEIIDDQSTPTQILHRQKKTILYTT